jgi:hypothetical protein
MEGVVALAPISGSQGGDGLGCGFTGRGDGGAYGCIKIQSAWYGILWLSVKADDDEDTSWHHFLC